MTDTIEKIETVNTDTTELATKSERTINTFSFGDPEPCLDNRMTEYTGIYADMNGLYSPPYSRGVGNFRSLFINNRSGKADAEKAIKIIPVGDISTKDEFERIKKITLNDMSVCTAHKKH